MDSWRQIQRENFTSLSHLADFLQLSQEQRALLISPSSFILNLPRRLADKMAKGTLDDPLVRQFVPLAQELNIVAGFVKDPVGDCSSQLTSRLLKKYAGRALLITTGACAMHCRYCFRREYDYQVSKDTFSAELELIAQDSSIREVMLSGGDPLSLSNEKLTALLKGIEAIEHVKIIRFHTRFPIGIPERLDGPFLNLVHNLKKQVYFVVHVNHPLELDDEVLLALKKLKVPLLNQAVLLKDVNDDEETLFSLCSKLIEHGILPYYLHQLDQVVGSAHFHVDEERGRELIEYLRKNLSGYAVPKYVREIEGEFSKSPLYRYTETP